MADLHTVAYVDAVADFHAVAHGDRNPTTHRNNDADPRTDIATIGSGIAELRWR